MDRNIHFSKAVLAWLCTCLLCFSSFSAWAQLQLDLESGVVLGTPYNEVRIPNRGGTLINLVDNLTAKPTVFYRFRVNYTIADRHTVSLLYAPLTVNYEGELGKDVTFTNQLFSANRPVNVKYQFNSYRLTYRYSFITSPKWRVGAGLTAKIRDADVRFTNESTSSNFANIGFVPLINLSAVYKPNEHLSLILEGDALGSRFGRAEDIFVGGAYAVNQILSIKAGYRVVEGGADVDDVYNFTWINYASAGLVLSF